MADRKRQAGGEAYHYLRSEVGQWLSKTKIEKSK
jgi:hypothetical protein